MEESLIHAASAGVALAERVAMRAIRLGGSCTGEHGIGLHRIHQLEAEHPQGVVLMRAIILE